jgi:hypothetical protein
VSFAEYFYFVRLNLSCKCLTCDSGLESLCGQAVTLSGYCQSLGAVYKHTQVSVLL